MKKEYTSDDLFVSEKKSESNKKVQIPSNYIEVKFSSKGKLSAPPVLHFRNYTMKEALLFSEINEQNENEVIVDVLNNIIWEDFDCALLHRQEAVEVLLNLYAAFYSNKIEGFRYTVDPDGDLNSKENQSVATIKISDIKTIPLDKAIKEPVSLTAPNSKIAYRFIYPRIMNSFITREYLNVLFENEEQEFSSVRNMVRNNQESSVDPSQLKLYRDYQRLRRVEAIKVYKAQLIHGIDDDVFDTIEAKIAASDEIPVDIWSVLDMFFENEGNFGIDPMVQFKCSVTGKSITRRFLFRLMDFVPTGNPENITDYKISFG